MVNDKSQNHTTKLAMRRSNQCRKGSIVLFYHLMWVPITHREYSSKVQPTSGCMYASRGVWVHQRRVSVDEIKAFARTTAITQTGINTTGTSDVPYRYHLSDYLREANERPAFYNYRQEKKVARKASCEVRLPEIPDHL